MNHHDTMAIAHVLIIDDERSIANGLADLLELEQFKTGFALTGEEGLDYLNKNPDTDIVLLDLNLGDGLSGLETLPLIKEKFKYAQVIMLTSQETLSIALECMRKGAFDYMIKPFNEERFKEKVDSMLEQKKLSQLNDLYLGILVHDLKNPVSNILLSVQALQMLMKDQVTERHKNFFLSAQRGIKQIDIMISNILSVTKFEKSGLKTRSESFILQEEVEHHLGVFSDSAMMTNTSFSVAFAPSLPSSYILKTDKELFFQVLWNLTSNAFRFSSAKGKITVLFSENEEGFIEVRVTNQGSFIEEDKRDRIFDKFYDVSITKEPRSTNNYGLGLTYSKMAVEAMGGSISVDGNPEVPETTFLFTVKNNPK